MADPQHIETLDEHDRLTVVLYRSGLGLAALGVLGAGLASAAVAAGTSAPLAPAWVAVAAGTALAGVNLHLYDKRVRWVIQAAAALGVLLQAAAPGGGLGTWVFHAGLGFQFVALSGLALKEQFCFRIPGLRAVPLLLAGSLVPLLGAWPAPAAGLLVPAGALLAVLAAAKWRMPLHFDIGDRRRYQV